MPRRLSAALSAAAFLSAILFAPAPLAGQQDPPRWSCCFNIYSVGSKLGSAGGLLLRITGAGGLQPDQSAAQSIDDELSIAANEAQNSCSSCSAYNNLWRGWVNLPNEIRRVQGLVRAGNFFGALTAIQSMQGWSQALNSVRVDFRYGAVTTCEESYYAIAWHLGWIYQNERTQAILSGMGSGNTSTFGQEAWTHAQALLQALDAYSMRRRDPACVQLNDGLIRHAAASVLQQPPIAPGSVADEVENAFQVTQTAVRQNCIFTPAFDGAGPSLPGWCILRKPAPAIGDGTGPCFQFYLADAAVADNSRMITITADRVTNVARCYVTSYAQRQGWEVDPSQYGGPYNNRGAADSALTLLSPFGGDAYGCHHRLGTQPSPPVANPPNLPVIPAPPTGSNPPNPPSSVPQPRPNPCPKPEIDALRKEIEGRNSSTWSPFYCAPGRPPVRWCNEYPHNVAGTLQWAVEYCGVAGRTTVTIRAGFACLDQCVMSLRDGTEAQRNACGDRCRSVIVGK